MSLPQGAGIYLITNAVTGKRYVGSARDIAARWRHHRNDLEAGVHHNVPLQRAVRKHGLEALAFTVLETCAPDRETLIAREQHYLDTLKPEYNTCHVAGSILGLRKSPEYRAWLSQRFADPLVVARRRKASLARWNDPIKRQSVVSHIRAAVRQPEYRERARIQSLQRWADPALAEKMRALISAIHSSPGMRDKKRKASRIRWEQPGARARQSAFMRQHEAPPETRAARGAETRMRWSDPEYRAWHTERTREAQLRPHVRAAKAERMRHTWDDSPQRAGLQSGTARYWADPENRKRRSEQTAALWRQPGHREAVAAAKAKRSEGSHAASES